MQVLDNIKISPCICTCSKSCKNGLAFTPAMLYDTPIWTVARSRSEVLMKHLTLSDRIRIEALLEEGKSFSQIAAELDKCPTTISREVRRHRSVVHHYSTPFPQKMTIFDTLRQKDRTRKNLVK